MTMKRLTVVFVFFCLPAFAEELNDVEAREKCKTVDSVFVQGDALQDSEKVSGSGSRSVFLSAKWKHLAIISFEVEPDVLEPYVPLGTELDFHNGKTYISLVAFLFEDTKVFGLVPAFFYRDFEEINLRFYVVKKEGRQTKRGVVFIKEIVPSRLLAWVARFFYHENYVALPTSHTISVGSSYEYRWGQSSLVVRSSGKQFYPEENSFERWITEHYWGYTRVSSSETLEYEVKHPVWDVYEVTDHQLRGDFAALYGKEFESFMKGQPASVILAQGSKVSVHWPTKMCK